MRSAWARVIDIPTSPPPRLLRYTNRRFSFFTKRITYNSRKAAKEFLRYASYDCISHEAKCLLAWNHGHVYARGNTDVFKNLPGSELELAVELKNPVSQILGPYPSLPSITSQQPNGPFIYLELCLRSAFHIRYNFYEPLIIWQVTIIIITCVRYMAPHNKTWDTDMPMGI